jgi:hypothetical protein
MPQKIVHAMAQRIGVKPPPPPVILARDVVAIEDAASFVSCQFSGDRVGHTGADKITYGGPTQVTRDAPHGTQPLHRPQSTPSDSAARAGLCALNKDPEKNNGESILLSSSARWTDQKPSTPEHSSAMSEYLNLRPSRFFVVPDSSLTTPAARSTWGHSSGKRSATLCSWQTLQQPARVTANVLVRVEMLRRTVHVAATKLLIDNCNFSFDLSDELRG